VTLAHLVLEIRHRATAAGPEVPRAVALEQAACEVLEPREGEAPKLARRILAALLGVDRGAGFDVAVLDAMTPDAILLLDITLGQINHIARRDARCSAERARSMRPVH
jgi:hypothetical protein